MLVTDFPLNLRQHIVIMGNPNSSTDLNEKSQTFEKLGKMCFWAHLCLSNQDVVGSPVASYNSNNKILNRYQHFLSLYFMHPPTLSLSHRYGIKYFLI